MGKRTVARIIYYILLSLAILYSVASLGRIEIEGDIINTLLPDDNLYQKESRSHEELYTSPRAVILTVSPLSENEGIWNTGFLEKLDFLVHDLSGSGYFSQVVAVTNLTTVPPSDTLEAVPFLDLRSSESIAEARNACTEVGILRQMFLSYDQKALQVYAIPSDVADELAMGRMLDQLKSDGEDDGLFISMMGKPYSEYMVRDMIIHNLSIMFPISMLLVTLFFFAITRVIRTALALTLFSGIPTILVFGMYATLGYTMGTLGVLLPIVLFSLTTAYSIHLFKGYEDVQSEADGVMKRLRLIILFAAMTTMLGYINLIFLNNDTYRHLGIGLVVGIILSVALVFTIMPVLFRILPDHTVIPWESRLRSASFPSGKVPLYILASMLTISLAGFIWLFPPNTYTQAYTRAFRSFSEVEKMMKDIEIHSKRPVTLDIYIDAEDEYGLIDPEVFHLIDSLGEKLKEHEDMISVVSFTDLTEYGNGLLYGSQREVVPRSIEEIGETLEFLSSQDVSVPLSMLITTDYRQAVMQISYSVDSVGRNGEVPLYRDIERMVSETFSQNENVTFFISGEPTKIAEIAKEIIKIMFRSVSVFILFVFLFGIAIFRSVRKGFLLLFPTLLGMVVFVGIAGWFHKSIDVNILFAFYTFLGISIDDTSYLLFSSTMMKTGASGDDKKSLQNTLFRSTGISIMETTAMLIVGLSPLLFAAIADISLSIIISMISYVCSTLTTLFILPRFTCIFGGSKR